MEKLIFSQQRRTTYHVLIISLFFSFLLISLNWGEIIDDAYIFFRYARNLASGYGYVYNRGEHVEGTTSVTWTLLLAVFAYFDAPMESTAKILSFLCILALVALIWWFFYKNKTPASITLFILALLIADKNFNKSLMMGLETGVYSLLLVTFFITAASFGRQRFSPLILGLVGIFLFLTRPESIALLLLISCGLMLFYFDKLKEILQTTGIWLVGILLISFWRLNSFGDFIPNSVRAKSVLGLMLQDWSILWHRLIAGASYFKGWFLSSWLLILLGLIGWIFLLKRKPFQGYVLGAIVFVGMAPVVVNSGDWMPFYRLLTPLLGIATLLAGACLKEIQTSLTTLLSKWLKVVIIVGTIVMYSNSFLSLQSNGFFVQQPKWPKAICYERTGEILHPYLSEQSVVVPEALGATSYQLADVYILDLFGLTDSFIARNGVIPFETYNFGKQHYEYVMQREPDLFFFHSYLTNHIPSLNDWGYSEKYKTFMLVDEKCDLLIGIKLSMVDTLLPVLESAFRVQLVDTIDLPKNDEKTWPQGEK